MKVIFVLFIGLFGESIELILTTMTASTVYTIRKKIIIESQVKLFL